MKKFFLTIVVVSGLSLMSNLSAATHVGFETGTGYVLATDGAATIGLSTVQKHTGLQSVKMQLSNGNPGIDFAKITIDYSGLLNNTIAFCWNYVPTQPLSTLSPYLYFILDANGNGIYDYPNDALVIQFNMPVFTPDTWFLNVLDQTSIVHVVGNRTGLLASEFSSSNGGGLFSALCAKTFSGTTKWGDLPIIKVRAGAGEWPGAFNYAAYVDDIYIGNYLNTPATAKNLYLSNSATVLNGNIYPNDSWPKPWEPAPDPGNGYPGDLGVDWGFKSALGFYIVPEVGSQFSACDITVEWDNTMYSFVGPPENTGIFSAFPLAFQTHQLGSTTRLTIQASILPGPSTPNYFTIGSGDYIVKLNFNSLKVGYGLMSFFDIDFRKYDGLGGFQDVFFLQNEAKVKSYLGDVASTTPASLATGDGKVNLQDLNAWTLSYWSGVAGYVPGLLYYKAKYDIGPTSTTTVYGMPTTDYKIQFEDLVIFAMSYGLSGNNLYPKIAPVPTEPVEVTVGKPLASGNETLVPIFISGAVQDLRAASFVLSGSFGKFISADKSDLLNSYTTPVMVLSRTDGNNVFVDLSIVGADVKGLSEEGQLFVLRFEGKANVNVTSAELRNLANSPMLVKLNGNFKGIPTEFGLSQNYPNPFNPSTVISYQVPVQSTVEISVFNSIGEKVATLINEVKEPGYYEVTWNAQSMTSGVYFFRVNAGEFTAVKKMLYMK